MLPVAFARIQGRDSGGQESSFQDDQNLAPSQHKKQDVSARKYSLYIGSIQVGGVMLQGTGTLLEYMAVCKEI